MESRKPKAQEIDWLAREMWIRVLQTRIDQRRGDAGSG